MEARHLQAVSPEERGRPAGAKGTAPRPAGGAKHAGINPCMGLLFCNAPDAADHLRVLRDNFGDEAWVAAWQKQARPGDAAGSAKRAAVCWQDCEVARPCDVMFQRRGLSRGSYEYVGEQRGFWGNMAAKPCASWCSRMVAATVVAVAVASCAAYAVKTASAYDCTAADEAERMAWGSDRRAVCCSRVGVHCVADGGSESRGDRR
uniref:Uncharacterized protein n=1 Tax=Zooxanthella nutricula TaxID=1333877 RepID=A0A7S2M0L4_9DINO